MRVKLAEALALAKLFDPVEVGWALGHAAVHGRFAEADLSSILDHHARWPGAGEHRASEGSSLTQGTSAWAQLGRPDPFGIMLRIRSRRARLPSGLAWFPSGSCCAFRARRRALQG